MSVCDHHQHTLTTPSRPSPTTAPITTGSSNIAHPPLFVAVVQKDTNLFGVVTLSYPYPHLFAPTCLPNLPNQPHLSLSLSHIGVLPTSPPQLSLRSSLASQTGVQGITCGTTNTTFSTHSKLLFLPKLYSNALSGQLGVIDIVGDGVSCRF